MREHGIKKAIKVLNSKFRLFNVTGYELFTLSCLELTKLFILGKIIID